MHSQKRPGYPKILLLEAKFEDYHKLQYNKYINRK